MMLDHGTLNIPLAKRGDIDAQIDRYKAQKSADERAARKAEAERIKADRAEAKALVAAVAPERLKALADHCKVTVATMKKRIVSDAHWQPKLIIRLLAA